MRPILDYYMLTAPADQEEVYNLVRVLQLDELTPEIEAAQDEAEARLERLIEKNQKK